MYQTTVFAITIHLITVSCACMYVNLTAVQQPEDSAPMPAHLAVGHSDLAGLVPPELGDALVQLHHREEHHARVVRSAEHRVRLAGPGGPVGKDRAVDAWGRTYMYMYVDGKLCFTRALQFGSICISQDTYIVYNCTCMYKRAASLTTPASLYRSCAALAGGNNTPPAKLAAVWTASVPTPNLGKRCSVGHVSHVRSAFHCLIVRDHSVCVLFWQLGQVPQHVYVHVHMRVHNSPSRTPSMMDLVVCSKTWTWLAVSSKTRSKANLWVGVEMRVQCQRRAKSTE